MARAPVTPPPARFVVLASVCVVIGGLYWMQDVLIPLALAVLLTFLLTPLVNRLERAGMNRVGSVGTVTLVAFFLMGVLGYVVADQVIDLGNDLPNYQDNIASKIAWFKPTKGGVADKVRETAEQVQHKLEAPATSPTTQASDLIATEIASQTNLSRVANEPSEAPAGAGGGDVTSPTWTADNPLPVGIIQPKPSPLDTVGRYLGVILGPLGTAGLVIVFVIFMLLSREDLRDRLIRLVGHRDLQVTTKALNDAAERISRYLVAQAIVNGTYGVAIAIGLVAIGYFVGGEVFPNFVLWGMLCALLRFIPYIGPWVAAAFPIAVSFAVYPGFGVFLATCAMFVVIELLSNNLMEPWLYGSSTGMSTIAILVSAVFWTFLWGPVGLLLATPLTVCLVVLGKYVPQLGFLDILLGDEPVLTPAERVYQRLLALDQEEVADLVAAYLKEMPLEQVYDGVLMPALGMAEQDRHRGRLDDEQRLFIRRVMRDLIDELGDLQREQDAALETAQIKAGAKAVEDAAKGTRALLGEGERPASAADAPAVASTAAPVGSGSGNGGGAGALAGTGGNGQSSIDEIARTPAKRPALPKDCVANVVILPAHDQADEIVGLMLGQLLALQGYCAFPQSMEKLASEMVEEIDTRAAHVVVVSAMPPAAVTHSRYLCKRIHGRFADIRMIVGLWTYKGDTKRAKERVACGGNVPVLTTLAEALDQIHQEIQPLLLRNENASKTPAAPAAAARE